jgi:hypothetical protein
MVPSCQANPWNRVPDVLDAPMWCIDALRVQASFAAAQFHDKF